MPPKIAWILAPLLLHALYLLIQSWRGKAVTRFEVNLQLSLMLMLYLLITAGLGLFWVANQQLPVFDIHYLFGYATLLLLSAHLYFNLPLVWRYWRRPRKTVAASAAPAAAPGQTKRILVWLGLPVLLCLAYWLGGQTAPNTPLIFTKSTPDANSQEVLSLQLVQRYHEFSSESRSSVFARASAIDWGESPAEFKTYPGLPSIKLPKATEGSDIVTSNGNVADKRHSLHAALRTSASRHLTLEKAELAQILHLGAGITAKRSGYSLRAAPSSGALFPAEVYAVVRNVAGLAAGIYHYDVQGQALTRLQDSAKLADLAMAAQAREADVSLVVTAVMRRTAIKYRDRAYRYVMADLGHLLENLRLGAHSVGMQAQPLAHFDDAAMAHALGLDQQQEPVITVLDLRLAKGMGMLAPSALQSLPELSLQGGALGVNNMIHQATSLAWQATPKAAAAGQIYPLPQALPTSISTWDAITQRRSQRRFSDAAVALPVLASLLQDMARAPLLSDAIRVHLVVNRVQGLPPGVYRYLAGQGLQVVRQGEFDSEAQDAALDQDVIGDAAVVLILSVPRQAIVAQGARAYRQAFLEAGMMGERWLLGAVAHGLAACPVGAFYDDEAANLISVNRQHEWVLHFAALGLPSAAK